MSRHPWSLGLLILSAPVWGQAAMPDWFWNPPGPGCVAVFARSDEEALSSGAKVLTTYGKSIVRGDVQQFFDDELDERTWKNTEYSYLYDQSFADGLKPNLEVKARYPVQLVLNQSVYLVGTKGAPEKITHTVVDPQDLSRPAWATLGSSPADDRWHGLGIFTLEGNPTDAWIKAEELGVLRVVLAKQSTLGTATTLKTGQGKDKLAQMYWIRLNVLVGDVRIDGRWTDLENNVAMVAVSAPKSSIRSME